MNSKKEAFYVGTSGWTYDHWKENFYPENIPKTRWFEHYAKTFKAVEINATFYRRFKDTTYYKWRERAPDNFLYVLKAPRVITHRKYLLNAENLVMEFWKSAVLLENHFGMVLMQLSPKMPYDPERLKKALESFPDPTKVAVEFRHEQWFSDEIRGLLAELGAVFCSVDAPKLRLMDWLTSDSAYIRLHGRKNWYTHDYSYEELEEILNLAVKMKKNGARKIFVFFNNDFEGHAPKNAFTFQNMLLDK